MNREQVRRFWPLISTTTEPSTSLLQLVLEPPSSGGSPGRKRSIERRVQIREQCISDLYLNRIVFGVLTLTLVAARLRHNGRESQWSGSGTILRRCSAGLGRHWRAGVTSLEVEIRGL